MASLFRGFRLNANRLSIGPSHPRIHLSPSLRRAAFTPFARRHYSVDGAQPKTRSPIWVNALLLAGIGLTAYGIYDIYTAMTIWPTEVREDLRDGLKAKQKGDLELCEQYFRRAWDTSKTLDLDLFKSDPYLKLSGIAIALADVLESQNKTQAAYDIYADALSTLQAARRKDALTGPERLRSVAVALKQGELAQTCGKPADEEEKWLVWGVEEVLKLVQDAQADPSGGLFAPGNEDGSPETRVSLAELELPPWVTATDVGATLEALAAFYGRVGKIDFALPLYLQAISLLIPPPPHQSSPEDKCRGAQLMGHISELIMQRQPSSEALHQADLWAKRSLKILHSERQKSAQVIPICEVAFAAALFNVAVISEMSGDGETARKFYTAGMEHSKQIGMEQGVAESESAIRRLDAAAPARQQS